MKWFVRLTIILLVSSACAPKTAHLSPIGKVAVYGSQFSIAGSAAATGIDTLITTNVLTRVQGLGVLQKMKIVADATVDLSQALADIDAAKTAADRTTAVGRAKGIVDGMAKALSDWSTIPDTKAKATVVAVLSSVSAMLTNLGNLLLGILAGGSPVTMQSLASEYTWTWRPVHAELRFAPR